MLLVGQKYLSPDICVCEVCRHEITGRTGSKKFRSAERNRNKVPVVKLWYSNDLHKTEYIAF